MAELPHDGTNMHKDEEGEAEKHACTRTHTHTESCLSVLVGVWPANSVFYKD